MRTLALLLLLGALGTAAAADLESRVLTHYLPQDILETAVRTEGWTELTLNVKGGVRKGDTIRIWTGGSIDRGNGDHPGQNVAGPCGLDSPTDSGDLQRLALSPEPGQAFALLFKNEGPGYRKPLPQGKPLEIPVTKDKEPLWVGFNDERGRYLDNHLGRGRRHEFDPLWVRIEVVRTIVD